MKFLPAIVALLPLAALPAAASSGAVSGAGAQVSASIDLRIVVPRVLEMRMLDHPAVVQVTPYDAANGEVVVSGARLELVSNDRHGYWIEAALRGPFAEATIEGLQVPVRIDANGGRILVPGNVGMARPKPYPVRYRLKLREGTPPGTYRWPVALSLESP
ncbi:MAG TPA: hypothetical protein VLS49_04310 [Usitatibacter sp.]|nr:hypothetical protein [Usitatibacter sp.]